MKCAGVQVDLMGRSPSGLLTVIEVKMNTARDVARVTPRQLARLKRVVHTLAQVEPVELRLLLVEERRVRMFPLGEG